MIDRKIFVIEAADWDDMDIPEMIKRLAEEWGPGRWECSPRRWRKGKPTAPVQDVHVISCEPLA